MTNRKSPAATGLPEEERIREARRFFLASNYTTRREDMKDSIVVNVRMEPEQVRALDILAGTENRTRSGMLRKIITECLDVPRDSGQQQGR